jgi:hypothetical protein
MHTVLELLGAGLVIYLVVRLLVHLFGVSKEKLRESYQEGFIEGKRHCEVCSRQKKQAESESFWKKNGGKRWGGQKPAQPQRTAEGQTPSVVTLTLLPRKAAQLV